MSTTKFLYLYRSSANAPSKPPSPEEIAKECPMNDIPGASIEIRELAGY